MNAKFNFKLTRKHILISLLFAAALLALWLLREPFSGFLAWVNDRQAITASIQQYGIWGQVGLFILLVLQVFVAVIPGHALILAGSYAYGFTTGLLITLASTVLSSQVAFTISRRYGRQVVYRLANPEVICRWDKLAAGQGALFFFFSFVLPIFPGDLMCYVAGLGNISPRRFFAANFMGRLVCAGFITLLGSNGLRMPPAFWAAAILCAGGLYLGWLAYNHVNLPNRAVYSE